MNETNPKAKLSMCALATALLGTPLTAVSADNVFIKTGEPGRWGEAENWQDQLPPNEGSTAIKFGKNEGLPFAACLKDGDDFVYPNATITVGCNARTDSKYTTVGLTIPTNASLKASAVSIGTAGATGLVEVVGGSLTTSGKITLANNGAQIRQVDGSVTSSYLDFTGSIDGPRYELLGGELKLDTASTAHGVWMRARYSSSFCQRGGMLTSSYIRLEASSPATAYVGPERYDFYDGEICLSGKSNDKSGVTFNSAGLATFCQHGGSLTATDIYFSGVGDGCSRYELLGGTLTLTGGIYQKKAYPAVFSVRGSAPKVTLSGIGSSVDDFSLLTEFVIDRTGAPSVGFAYNGTSSTLFLSGAYAVKLDGGLQLLHTNVFGFVDSHVEGRSAAHVKAATKRYADLNTAERHLWTFGPYMDANGNPTGVLAKTKCFGAQLNPSEEFVPGRRYDGGRSCGWVQLPRFKSAPNSCRVLLDVEPQGEHTLDEIAEGLTASGYPTKCVSGTSILRVTLPAGDIRVGSTNEVVAFDFAEYGAAASVRALVPTDVRALVRQVDVVQSSGLMILLK